MNAINAKPKLYKIRYRGCYKGDTPDPDDRDVGKILEWTMEQILAEINRERSSGWTDYDETDWVEGLTEWTCYEPAEEAVAKTHWEGETMRTYDENGPIWDPARLTKSVSETDDDEDKVSAFADSIVFDPDMVHRMYTTEATGDSRVPGRQTITVVFRNAVGATVEVDSVIESMTRLDWRRVCDGILERMITLNRRNPDKYNWPTPRVAVTTRPDDDDPDVCGELVLEWEIDVDTAREVRRYISRFRSESEETCVNCDSRIPYRHQAGRTAVRCHRCGAVNPLCSDCERPDGPNACRDCDLAWHCREVNKALGIGEKGGRHAC